jgi:hypothetical protein
VLLLLVGEHRVAGPEVDRGYAQGAEAGHVGPAELRFHVATHGLDERLGCRQPEPGHGAGRAVGEGHVVALEELSEEGLGLGLGAVGGEPVVHRDDALVGKHVAGDATADEHRVEPLVVLQPVDHRLARLERIEPGQHVRGAVDRVDALPAARGVGTLPRRTHVDPHRALATALDVRSRRLHQDREVRGHQLGVGLAEDVEAVELLLDLLGVVEDERQVAVGLADGRGEPKDDGVASLHVAGAEAVQQAALPPCRQVVVERHRVEVTGDHDPLAAPELGPGHDRVAVSGHREVRQPAQRGLDGVGDRLLVAADRLDVDELLGERDGIGVEVEGRHGLHPTSPRRAAAHYAPTGRWRHG